MATEFNLSEKIDSYFEIDCLERCVKNLVWLMFMEMLDIKRLKEGLVEDPIATYASGDGVADVNDFIDKLAGDKLINGN